MRIGIFGGSFNPPHKTHLRIALDLINKNYIDKVIFVPTGSKYKYKNNLVSDYDRLNMIKLLIKNHNNVLVSDFELQEKEVYTYETLKYFKDKYSSDEIYFICGLVIFSYIDKWKNSDELLRNNKFLVIKRNGDNEKVILDRLNDYKDNIFITDVIPSDVSSTMIRNKILNNEDVLEFIDKEVLEYIKDNNLYEV